MRPWSCQFSSCLPAKTRRQCTSMAINWKCVSSSLVGDGQIAGICWENVSSFSATAISTQLASQKASRLKSLDMNFADARAWFVVVAWSSLESYLYSRIVIQLNIGCLGFGILLCDRYLHGHSQLHVKTLKPPSNFWVNPSS